MSKFDEKVKKLLESLSPKTRRFVVAGSVVLSLLLMLVVSYKFGGNKTFAPPKQAAQKASAPIEPELLGKSLYNEQERALRQRDDELKGLKDEFKKFKEDIAKGKEPSKERAGFYPPVPVPTLQAVNGNSGNAVTTPTSYPAVPSYPAGPQQRAQSAQQTGPQWAGDIEIMHNSAADKKSDDLTGEKKDKKKDVEIVHLPPCFMPAVLLNGVRAKTASGGKGEPQPLLFRITDLAVLPGRITKNLTDCFVVAAATGDLSMERVDVRLVSLHCEDRGGRVAIDQEVYGTAIDSDGIDNLNGKVVARWGSALLSSGAAGAFAGIGDAMKAASTQTLMNSATTLQQVKPSDMLEGAAGSGLSSTFAKMSDFMLKIAEQTMPVVETGNKKKCTIFIQKSVDLQVKKYCDALDTLGGAKCEDGE